MTAVAPDGRPTPAAGRLTEMAGRLTDVDRALWNAMIKAATATPGWAGDPRTARVMGRYEGLIEAYAIFASLPAEEVERLLRAELERRYGPPGYLDGWWGSHRAHA